MKAYKLLHFHRHKLPKKKRKDKQWGTKYVNHTRLKTELEWKMERPDTRYKNQVWKAEQFENFRSRDQFLAMLCIHNFFSLHFTKKKKQQNNKKNLSIFTRFHLRIYRIHSLLFKWFRWFFFRKFFIPNFQRIKQIKQCILSFHIKHQRNTKWKKKKKWIMNFLIQEFLLYWSWTGYIFETLSQEKKRKRMAE